MDRKDEELIEKLHERICYLNRNINDYKERLEEVSNAKLLTLNQYVECEKELKECKRENHRLICLLIACVALIISMFWGR